VPLPLFLHGAPLPLLFLRGAPAPTCRSLTGLPLWFDADLLSRFDAPRFRLDTPVAASVDAVATD